MASGGPGDHPVTDIVRYGVAVFSPATDLMIAEIVALGGAGELEERYGGMWWGPSSGAGGGGRAMPRQVRGELRALRNRLVERGRASGWEVDRLLSDAAKSFGRSQ
ncbi:MAG: hypothetical protein ACRDZ2_11175 [Ilumatobacteraceae bacterium]